jgi:hypothetical protein
MLSRTTDPPAAGLHRHAPRRGRSTRSPA